MLRRLLPLATVLTAVLLGSTLTADDTAPGEHPAILHPAARVALSPDAEGLVAEVHVERGDTVVAGQLLARLESGVEQAEYELARARAEATAALDSAELDLEQREREFARAQSLELEGFETAERLDAAAFEVARARVALEAARLEQELARRELERAAARLARREIRAPRDGVVVERHVEVGQRVGRAEGEPLLVVASLAELIADVRLPASLFGTVSVGDAAVVSARPGTPPQHAVVASVDRSIDPASSTFRVRVRLDRGHVEATSNDALPAGARVSIRLGDLQ